MAKPTAPAASDSEEDRSMDPDDACDYVYQSSYPDDADSPGRINHENLEFLAAVLKCIPECIDELEADFARLADLLQQIRPVNVAKRTVQEEIALSQYAISQHDTIL